MVSHRHSGDTVSGSSVLTDDPACVRVNLSEFAAVCSELACCRLETLGRGAYLTCARAWHL